MADAVQEPGKELRFTRAGQGATAAMLAAVLFAAAVMTAAISLTRGVPHPLWALLPAACGALVLRAALRMIRHAYLILTPLGIEIFPLLRPEKTMRLVLWNEIHSAEVDADLTTLTLHHDASRTSGIHLTLSPIRPDRRALLAKAVAGRLSPP